MNIKDIKELSPHDLVEWLEKRKQRSFRAKQILKWVYMKQVNSFDEMTDLSKNLRDTLKEEFTLNRLNIKEKATSTDGTVKYLFELNDNALIESVLIPEKDHFTLCVSTQVGCAQGCRFCMTGKGGLKRNLSRGEIIGQVRDISKYAEKLSQTPIYKKQSKALTNLVFMGMGEPLANYANLMDALEIFKSNEYGLKFANRKMTVSTCGLVNRIHSLGEDTQVNLAVSLNAGDDETRSLLMPVNKTYPISTLLEACETYPMKAGRRITFEYILMKDVNDSKKDAENLANLLKHMRRKSKVNLIPFNPHEGAPYKRPEEKRITAFQEILAENDFTAVVRESKGKDIMAACGQLKANAVKEENNR